MELILSLAPVLAGYIATIGLFVISLKKLQAPKQAPTVRMHAIFRLLYLLIFIYAVLAAIAITLSGFASFIIAKFLVGPISIYLLCALTLTEYLYKKLGKTGATTPKLKTIIKGFVSLIIALVVADLVVAIVFYGPLVLQSESENSHSRIKKYAADFTEYIPNNLPDESVKHEEREYKSQATYKFRYGQYAIRESAWDHTLTLCTSSQQYTCDVFGRHNEGDIYRKIAPNNPNSATYLAVKKGTLLTISVSNEQPKEPEDMAMMINSMTKNDRRTCSPTPLGRLRILCTGTPKDYVRWGYQD